MKDFFAHPTSEIDENVTIGKNTRIRHFSHILKNTVIGENCNLGQNVVAGPDVQVGSGFNIQNNVSLYKGGTLEDDVFCGPSMVFTNVFNPMSHVRRMDEVRPTRVKKDDIGCNFRMPNLNAALACAQLERLPDILQKKRQIAIAYNQFFKDKDWAEFLEEPEGTCSNYWLCAIALTN